MKNLPISAQRRAAKSQAQSDTLAKYDPDTGILQDSRQFRMLAIGDTFDFISPNRIMNSFYLRCIKTGTRKYRDERETNHRVGSIKCTVYNVIPAEETMIAAHKAGRDYAREIDSSAKGAAAAAKQYLACGAFMAGYYGELRRMTTGAAV